jgi:hypothetical protein
MSTHERFELSSCFYDGLPLEAVVADITGADIGSFPVGEMLEAAGVDRRTAFDMEDRLVRLYIDATQAAFTAGIAVGLDPGRVLLTRLQAATDRLQNIVDGLGGAQ